MQINNTVTIYTDGSCLGNPGPGGYAAKLNFAGQSKIISGGFAKTTNNRMELLAAIMALKSLKRPCKVDLHTDSRYLCDAVEKRWLTGWVKRNWKKSDGKPVLNQDLWIDLLPLLQTHKVKFHWVQGHAGHSDNEEVDVIAKEAASKAGLPADLGFA